MIVRDEVDVLGRCLDSCVDLIDHWVICDTGSTDGTQDLIRTKLGGIPGDLYEHEWVDFGHNRSRLMGLARGRADYLLLLDADTTIEAHAGALANLDADAYLLRHADESRYFTKRLVSGALDWRYLGAVHEYITCDQERTTGRLEDVAIHSWSAGGSRKGRWRRDAELLERELETDPASARSVFYLAQTYRDIGHETDDRSMLARAREQYERRGEMQGWEEETYVASYQAGLLSAELGEWPAAADWFLAAWEQRPSRLEAIQSLVAGLRERRRYRTARQFTQISAALTALPVPEDILFVKPWVYEWGMLFEHSITTYWCEEFDTSILACKRLLSIESLPEAHRRQTQLNMQHALRERVRVFGERSRASPRVLPHVGTPTTARPGDGEAGR